MRSAHLPYRGRTRRSTPRGGSLYVRVLIVTSYHLINYMDTRFARVYCMPPPRKNYYLTFATFYVTIQSTLGNNNTTYLYMVRLDTVNSHDVP
jgi:hypothetical protein